MASNFREQVGAVTEEFRKQEALAESIANPKGLGAMLDAQKAVTAEMGKSASLAGEIASFDAKRYAALKQQEAVLRKMKEDADGTTAAKQKAAAIEQQATAAKQREAAAAADVAKQTEAAKAANAESASSAAMQAEALGAAGAALGVATTAAKALYDELDRAYQKTVAFMEEWGGFGAKLAIEETGKADLQRQIFQKLGGNYDVAVQLGLKYGIGDKSVSEFKELLQAKFSEREIPLLIKVAAGMDATKEGSGQGFLAELQKLKLEPKVKAKDLEGLWKLGLDSKAVYADLAKTLGVTVPEAMAKVKAGAVDSETVIKAIERAAEKSSRGISGALEDNVLVMLERVKGDAQHLFDSVNLAPLKNAIKNAIAAIEGGPGQELKAAVNDLFGSAFGTAFGDFEGAKGKAQIAETFHDIAQAVHDAAAAVRSLRPEIQTLLADLHQMQKDGSLKAFVEAGRMAAQKKIHDVTAESKETAGKARLLNDPQGELAKGVAAQQWGVRAEPEAPAAKAAADQGGMLPELAKGLGADASSAAKEALEADATEAGVSLPDGMAMGIRGGEGEAIVAAEEMAAKALAAAKAKLDAHSPSEAFGELGDNSAEGLARNMARHPGPAAAGRQMAAQALGGAQGTLAAGAGAGTAGGTPGAGGDTFNVTINAGGGGEAKAQWEAMLPVVRADMRRIVREAREGARSGP